MGASSFMMQAELSLNQKFGYTITTTMAISFLISMVYFGAMMHIIGPENGFGNLDVIFAPLYLYLKAKFDWIMLWWPQEEI